MVRRRAQRAVSNHGSKLGLAAILRDALASLGLLRMRSEGWKGSQPLSVTDMSHCWRSISHIKKPGIAAGLFDSVQEKTFAGLRRLVLDRLVFLGRLGGTTARALGERGLDLLDRLGLGDTLDGCDLAREPVQRRLVELTLGVGLLRLRLRAIEVAHDLGDRHDVAGVDLGLVFLRPPRPHGALDPGTALERLQCT